MAPPWLLPTQCPSSWLPTRLSGHRSPPPLWTSWSPIPFLSSQHPPASLSSCILDLSTHPQQPGPTATINHLSPLPNPQPHITTQLAHRGVQRAHPPASGQSNTEALRLSDRSLALPSQSFNHQENKRQTQETPGRVSRQAGRAKEEAASQRGCKDNSKGTCEGRAE